MFSAASVFNQNIGSWNTVSVTEMNGMFNAATNFNQDISSWNTGAVVTMGSMFKNAIAFNQNIGAWNVSNVTNFIDFMLDKTNLTFSTTNLDAIYNGWSSRAVKPSIVISFGTAKYTAASSAGRAILTGAPNLWSITDGGI
jgi:surface protein